MEYSYEEGLPMLFKEMAEGYYKYILPILVSDSETVRYGIMEGAGKYLSNAYINAFRLTGKYAEYNSDLKRRWLFFHKMTEAAAKRVMRGELKDLRFEHVVPKCMYQDHFKEQYKAGLLKSGDVENMLKEFWLTATVTGTENEKLSRYAPKGYDLNKIRENKYIRYINANLYEKLQDNPLIPYLKIVL